MLQAWVIWNLCTMENRIISVERILQYTSIPSEPPLVLEENRPSISWPSRGEINICSLQVHEASVSSYLTAFTVHDRPIFATYHAECRSDMLHTCPMFCGELRALFLVKWKPVSWGELEAVNQPLYKHSSELWNPRLVKSWSTTSIFPQLDCTIWGLDWASSLRTQLCLKGP